MAPSKSLKDVKAIVYDCDGVLTDNKVMVDEKGNEYAIFNRADGYAISKLSELGIKQAVISTEISPIVQKRCQKLNLEVYNGIRDKKYTLEHYCKEKCLKIGQIMYIGNDLNDVECMKCAGLCGCPSDAETEIIEICDWISNKKGGDGVVRDLYREICKSRGV